MNNKILITILTIMSFFNYSIVNAQFVDHSFSYQGELMDDSALANGLYDMTIQAHTTLTGVNIIGGASVHENGTLVDAITVTDGLFTIDNVNLGLAAFDGEDIWLEVSVKKSTDAGASYVSLSPRQKVTSVPYATNLADNGAATGQVLTFDGDKWGAATNISSPWSISGQNIYYNAAGSVGIGTTAGIQAALNVKSSYAESARFDGTDDMYVWFLENGSARGYIGSYQTPNGEILDEDFEIGTTGGSIGNMHIVTGDNEPRITVDKDGNVGIGTTNPSAALEVIGDVKQPVASNGMMKYMVKAQCGTSSQILNSYNGISTDAISINSWVTNGKCTIIFPHDISNRYVQVSAPSSAIGTGVRTGSCDFSGTNSLNCIRFNPTSGVGVNGSLMILVY